MPRHVVRQAASPRPRKRRKRPLEWPQLALWTAGESGADLVPTRVLRRDRSCPRILETIRQVRAFFPELDGVQIKVGITRRAAGFASTSAPWIWINPHRLRRHTIAHEIVHLLQARGLVPAGEKAADLFALARHPGLADDLPCYLRIPRSLRAAPAAEQARTAGLLHQIAREALTRRAEGYRTYLRWFEIEVDSRWRERQKAVPVPGAVCVQAELF